MAAKTLLASGFFNVTVFEKKTRIGGIWAVDRQSTDGFLSPETPTNLSRFTCSFSDLDWQSVDLSTQLEYDVEDGVREESAPPMFPKAWQINRYLQTYRKKYIPDNVIYLNHDVVKAERIESHGEDCPTRWRVTTEGPSEQEVEEYDYLVLASGFFSRPRSLQQSIPGVENVGCKLVVPVLHTSQFRRLEGLLSQTSDTGPKKVLVIGGGNSSGETAAAVAMQLSNAMWSSEQDLSQRCKTYKVVHVTPRPLYALPPFVEYEPKSRSYVPLDLRLYDFSRRPSSLESYGGKQAPEVRDIVHGAIQTMLGGDQSDLGAHALVSQEGKGRGTAYVALTETYSGFVRDGLIEVVAGRVTAIQTSKENDTASALVQLGDETFTIDGIAAIIYATGYTPASAIDFLSDDVKDDLQYDASSMRLPFILEQWQTMSSAVPNLSLLGFYEGPYWPM